jgi:hypothetical protein
MTLHQLQFKLRKESKSPSGTEAHFQVGRPHSYKTFDILLREDTLKRLEEIQLTLPSVYSLANTGSADYRLVSTLAVFVELPAFHKIVVECLSEADYKPDAAFWDGTEEGDRFEWFHVQVVVRANVGKGSHPDKWDWPVLLEVPEGHVEVWEVDNLNESEPEMAEGYENGIAAGLDDEPDLKALVDEWTGDKRFPDWPGPSTDPDQWDRLLGLIVVDQGLAVIDRTKVNGRGWRVTAVIPNVGVLRLGSGRGWRIDFADGKSYDQDDGLSGDLERYKGVGWRDEMASDIEASLDGYANDASFVTFKEAFDERAAS